MRVSEPVWSQNSKKCHFYFCAMSRNAENRNIKMTSSTDTGFWAICLPKNGYINLKFSMPDVQARFYNILCVFVFLFENFECYKKLYKKRIFLLFGLFFFRNSDIWTLKNFSIYGFRFFLFAFCIKFLFLLIFQTFIHFWSKMTWHWVT